MQQVVWGLSPQRPEKHLSHSESLLRYFWECWLFDTCTSLVGVAILSCFLEKAVEKSYPDNPYTPLIRGVEVHPLN